MHFSAKKELSQNFLVDQAVLEDIAALVPKEPILFEIGCGFGALTATLLKYHHQILAIEKDIQFAPALKKLKEQYPSQFTYYFCDLLDSQVDQLFSTQTSSGYLVGNLPYHLTTEIFFMLFERFFLHGATIMIQKEVADDIFAHKGLKGTIAKLFCDEMQYYFVSKKAFAPMPKVDSAVLSFKINRPTTAQLKLVKQAFVLPRKTLANNFKNTPYEAPFQQWLIQEQIPDKIRAGALTKEQWISLFSCI